MATDNDRTTLRMQESRPPRVVDAGRKNRLERSRVPSRHETGDRGERFHGARQPLQRRLGLQGGGVRAGGDPAHAARGPDKRRGLVDVDELHLRGIGCFPFGRQVLELSARHGDGPRTFLAFHGWGGDHRKFAPLAARLPDGIRLLSADLPGYGQSPKPSRWEMAEIGGEIIRGMDERDLNDVTLVGFCSGARQLARMLFD